MTRFIAPAILAAGSAGADSAVRFLEHQPVGLTNALGIAASVGAACIWLEHRLTKIETRLDDLPCIEKLGREKPCRKTKRKK